MHGNSGVEGPRFEARKVENRGRDFGEGGAASTS